MRKIKVTKDSLVQTDKGRGWIFDVGEQVDHLEILERAGKRYVSSASYYEPVYLVRCRCGNEEYKQHRYLVSALNIRCCTECNKKIRSEKVSETRRLQREGIYKEEEYTTTREEMVNSILNSIWSKPIWELERA